MGSNPNRDTFLIHKALINRNLIDAFLFSYNSTYKHSIHHAFKSTIVAAIGRWFLNGYLEKLLTGSDPDNYFANTDWWKTVVCTFAPIQRHTASIRGGTDELNYFASVGLLDQKSVFKNGASPLFNKANDRSRWDKAATACKAAIDYNEANGASLFPDYGKIFTTPYNSEEILVRSYWSGQTDLDWGLRSNLDTYLNSPSNGGWCSLCPTQDMVESYETKDGKKITDPTSGYKLEKFWENRDPRLAQSILYDGSMWNGHQIETFLPGGVDSNEAPVGYWNYSVTGYFVKKFLKEGVAPGDYDTKNGSPQHNIIFRLAELYLNYAETQIEVGNDAEARKYINLVRARSSMPPVTESGDALKERYRNERKVELFMENHRYHDLRRWNIATKTMDNKATRGIEIRKAPDGTKTYSIADRQVIMFPEKYKFVPIPKEEIDRSNKVLIQNDGY